MTVFTDSLTRKFIPTPSCHTCSGGTPAKEGVPTIAAVGVPNSGKSALFNSLTGTETQMDNQSGTTVEVSHGAWRTDAAEYDVIDFPGTYSLDATSLGKGFTREMLIERPGEGRPDFVVVVVNATALGRGLYMAAELAKQLQRIALALTKLDTAKARGIDVNPDTLQSTMGMSVATSDPRREAGTTRLADVVAAALDGYNSVSSPIRRADGDSIERLDGTCFAVIDVTAATAMGGVEDRQMLSGRIDNMALHPVFGPIAFLAITWAVSQITTTMAASLQDGLETLITGSFADPVTRGLEAMGWDYPIATGLLVNSIIGGVGMVLISVPLMALMLLCLAALGNSGYMARAAVVADRVTRVIGLPGKAFTPLIVGFGCDVPVTSATHVLGNPYHRTLTTLLIPFASCSMRLTVHVMLGAMFFPEHTGTVVLAMYVILILLIIPTDLALCKTLWRTMSSEPLVINLPAYQLPTTRLALSVMWMRLKGLLQTANGVIVSTVIIVRLLMPIPVVFGHSPTDEGLAPQDSVYGTISAAIAPVFGLVGFGTWSLTDPLVMGFMAKEAVIFTWAQIYAVEDVTDPDSSEQVSSPFAENTRRNFDNIFGGNGLTVVQACMIFLLACAPYVVTLATQRREISLRRTDFGLPVQLVITRALVAIVFQGLKLFL